MAKRTSAYDLGNNKTQIHELPTQLEPKLFLQNLMNSPENNSTPGHPAVSGEVITLPETHEADSDLWTTERVAKFLHVSLKTVFNLRKKGLPYVQLGGAVRFVPQEIKDYLVTSRGLSAHRLRQMVRKGVAL
jgi:hypothetical protein